MIQETEQEHSYDTVHTIEEEEQLEATDTQEKAHAELPYQERVACLVRVVGRPVSKALAAVTTQKTTHQKSQLQIFLFKPYVMVSDTCRSQTLVLD